MAGGNVKKGFATYLFILLLIIVAAFLLVVVIMLFSPFKNILGFQYFFYNVEDYNYSVTTTKNSEDAIDFTTIKQINVESDYASVQVSRYVQIDTIAIRISNNAKGFAKSDQDTSFSYEIAYDQDDKSIINISIKEPSGFLFFTKDISVEILIPSKSTYTLENITLNVNNTSGDVLIGSINPVSSGEVNVGIGSINVKTISGDFIIFPYIDNSLNNVFIKTESGAVDVRADLTIKNSFKVFADNSKIEIKDLTMENTSESLVLNINNSKFFAETITGDISLVMKSGYIEMDVLNGSINANDAVQQMESASIRINHINGGNVSLPYANNSYVNIRKVSTKEDGTKGQIYIHATTGTIILEEIYAESWIESTSGNVTVHTYSDDVSIKTTSGHIDLTYESSKIDNQLDLQSENGQIDISLRSDLAFVLEIYNLNGDLRDSSNIDFDFYNGEFNNPLVVNNGTKVMKIVSNGKIILGLLNIN